MEMLIHRHYKEIKPNRILDISNLNIIPLGTNEVFVKLMDYKNDVLVILLLDKGYLVRYYFAILYRQGYILGI